jgi:hypothetical protein
MKKTIGLILMLGALQNINAQTFLIIQFEVNYRFGVHKEQSLLWILENPSDSLEEKISPLLLSGYSVNDLEACYQERPVDPLIQTIKSSYIFNDSHYASITTLRNLIASNRKLLQTMKVKWKSGQRFSVSIYATPVIGNFCSTFFTDYRQRVTNHYGRVYFPGGEHIYDDSFWKSEIGREISSWDFSRIEFNKIN